ncbi:histidinol dehydrogenase [Candidatus Fermentibacterales bacterium]|nr:histidinol dehydrogenase [Candidatus Fermentibacterales bacterium]
MRTAEGAEALGMVEEHEASALGRPFRDGVASAVASIVEEVREGGLEALRAVARRLGDPEPVTLGLRDPVVDSRIASLDRESQRIIDAAAENLERFFRGMMDRFHDYECSSPGFQAGLRFQPVRRVGCYVPGGRHPLPSSALMTCIPARAAGVREVHVYSPSEAAEVLYAARRAGADTISSLGGAQAVAAMTFGSGGFPRVDMIAGPGNRYFTEAKRQLYGLVGVDMIAGPSEVAVIADCLASPRPVALDLLAQAEHDPDARCWLLTDSPALARAVESELLLLTGDIPRRPGETGLSERVSALVLDSLEDCIAACNRLAPEHLELHLSRGEDLALEKLEDYGAVFIGAGSCVAFGDYMAGPDHTLPTGTAARFSGSLSPMSFLRVQGWVRLAAEGGGEAARDVAAFARMEGLEWHARAAEARLDGESV